MTRHPIAATGARMLTTLVYELGRRGGGIGVAAMCAGGGQGARRHRGLTAAGPQCAVRRFELRLAAGAFVFCPMSRLA